MISFVALQLNKLRRRIEETDNPSLFASRDNPSLLASSDEKAERLWSVVKGKVATMDVAAGQRQILGAPPGGRSAGVPVGLLGRARCLQSTRFPFAETGARMSVAWYGTCLDVPIVHDFLFCKTWLSPSPGPPSTWPVLASSRCLGMLGRTDAGKTPGWRRARVWGKPVGGWSGRARVGTIRTIIMRPRDTILRALPLTSSCGENNTRVMMNQLIKSCNAVRAGAFRDFSFRLASRAQSAS